MMEESRYIEIKSSKGLLCFEIEAKGSLMKNFKYPNGEIPFEATKIRIKNTIDNKIIVLDSDSTVISPSDLWIDLFDMSDSGTYSYIQTKKIVEIMDLDWISLEVISEESSDCDCCGYYEIIKFIIKNSKSKKEMSCVCDTHFYSGELPDMKELMDFFIEDI